MATKTSEILSLAAGIASRFERKGQSINATEAIARARAAQLQLQQIKALREQYPGDWDDTVPCPALPDGVSIAA